MEVSIQKVAYEGDRVPPAETEGKGASLIEDCSSQVTGMGTQSLISGSSEHPVWLRCGQGYSEREG